MKKTGLYVMIFVLTLAGTAFCQDGATTQPMLDKGTKELGISGNIDLVGAQGDIDLTINGSYGYFMNPRLEVGPFLGVTRASDGEVMSYSVGGFGEYHYSDMNWVRFAATVPYVGANLGFNFTDTSLAGEEDKGAVIFTPRVGIKWFFREYVAVDTNFFVSFASEDIYYNDNDLESSNYGFLIGLRAYFR